MTKESYSEAEARELIRQSVVDGKLIEEAAKAIGEAREVVIPRGDGYVSVTDADNATLARAALAVFEKALGEATVTPTDDGRIAPEDGMTLEELGNAMLSASDQWDGDESMHSIVYRFIEHYAKLDAEIHAAREAADFEDDVEILFRWDWESGTLKRVEASEPQDEPSDAQIDAALRAALTVGEVR